MLGKESADSPGRFCALRRDARAAGDVADLTEGPIGPSERVLLLSGPGGGRDPCVRGTKGRVAVAARAPAVAPITDSTGGAACAAPDTSPEPDSGRTLVTFSVAG